MNSDRQTFISDWRKVVYRQDDGIVKTIQGVFSDKGDFVEVKGDFKEVLVNKSCIIAIHKLINGLTKNGR